MALRHAFHALRPGKKLQVIDRQINRRSHRFHVAGGACEQAPALHGDDESTRDLRDVGVGLDRALIAQPREQRFEQGSPHGEDLVELSAGNHILGRDVCHQRPERIRMPSRPGCGRSDNGVPPLTQSADGVHSTELLSFHLKGLPSDVIDHPEHEGGSVLEVPVELRLTHLGQRDDVIQRGPAYPGVRIRSAAACTIRARVAAPRFVRRGAGFVSTA